MYGDFYAKGDNFIQCKDMFMSSLKFGFNKCNLQIPDKAADDSK